MQTDANDLTAFRDFVIKQVETNPSGVTPEDLVRQWRRDGESNEIAEALRIGLAEYEAGGGRSVDEVMDEICQRLGVDK